MLKIVHRFTIFYIIVLILLLELPSVPPEVMVLIGVPKVKYAHLITFAMLGFLVELGRCKHSMRFWISILLLCAVGTELLQWLLYPICYRCCDWVDMVNNIVGLFLGIFTGYVCRPYIKRPSETPDTRE